MKKFFKENLFYKFVALFVLFTAALNLYMPEIKKGDPAINERLGEPIRAEGLIVTEPDLREDNQKLTVRLNDVKVLVTTDLYEKFEYGDRIGFESVFKRPENFLTETGRQFDYVSYLLKDDIYYLASYPEIEILARGEGNPLLAFLYEVKNSFLKNIHRHIREPEGSLAGGLLLGGQSAMGKELQNDFIRTGIIHIVALSGFNVTIVAEFVAGFFMFFLRPVPAGRRRKLANWLGILSIVLFVLMVGAKATAVRAGIMAVLAFLARATGRTYDITRALAIALSIMLLQNPWILLHDVSFQLSFIATIGIIYLTPRFEKYFKWAPEILDLKNIMPTTLAAYVFVLPFIVYQMGNLSLVALPVNFLVLPFVPPAMLFIFLTGLFGFVLNLAALPFAYLSYFLLHYIISVARLFSQIPFASVAVETFPLWLMFTCYFFLLRYIKKSAPNSGAENSNYLGESNASRLKDV